MTWWPFLMRRARVPLCGPMGPRGSTATTGSDARGQEFFYASGHALNVALRLPGRTQTNQRAELFAVVVAVERDLRRLDIRSDSKYVVDGANELLNGGTVAKTRDHRDLWSRLRTALRSAGRGTVSVSWVKGHAKQVDVVRGRITQADLVGNHGADALAVAGAFQHMVPGQVAQEALRRQTLAIATHRMMVRIIAERQNAENFLGLSHDDPDEGESLADVFRLETFGSSCLPSEADPG